jgi:hypothetical protein
MNDRSDRISPQVCARIAGLLYLYTILGGLFAEFYVGGGKMVVAGDANATAAHILASESLFRTALAIEITSVAAYAGVSLLLYVLLRPVSKNVALSSVIFATIGNIVWLAGSIFELAAIRMLRGGTALSAFSTDQVQALALQNLKTHNAALGLGMLFFGVYCILIGILIFRSGYLPKAIGVLLVIGGASYFVSEVTSISAPAIAMLIPDWVQLPGLIAEVSLMLWLLAGGVNLDAWHRVRVSS